MQEAREREQRQRLGETCRVCVGSGLQDGKCPDTGDRLPAYEPCERCDGAGVVDQESGICEGVKVRDLSGYVVLDDVEIE